MHEDSLHEAELLLYPLRVLSIFCWCDSCEWIRCSSCLFARSIRAMSALLRVVAVFGQEEVIICVWLENDRVRTSMNQSECGVPCRVSDVPNVCGFEDVKVCCEALWSAWCWDAS